MDKRFDKISHFYFIGIGGIGMSALARFLNAAGYTVAGYDKVMTTLTQQLEKEGIAIHYHDDFAGIDVAFKNIEKVWVIYTPAVPQDFGELIRFRKSGIKILKRAQLLGEITKTTPTLAIAGTHGKTTTSAILAHLLYASGEKLTGFMGGILEGYESNLIQNGDEVLVVEADEYDRSFLNFYPDYLAITSMDADHLDVYGDGDALEETFKEFASKVPASNRLVKFGLPVSGLTVGMNPASDYHPINLTVYDGAYQFDMVTPNGIINKLHLNLPGTHNLLNAMMAIALASLYGTPTSKLARALASFKGVKRRFTYKIKSQNVILIDDYAHHPQEIAAVLQGVQEMHADEKICAVFQPHLFSRTQDFMVDFGKVLAQFDIVNLLDIYPARELPIDGVTSSVLAQKVNQHRQHDQPKCAVILKENILATVQKSNCRIILMIGAGDIGVEVEQLTQALHEKV